ncbi:MAG TPA: anaerobic glycerol-3-phosphate dehydrogenase subunit C [Spirochaetia bacterium]|nr:anaerobic glycerol-3-phosphate dehydrogenase subunit C [Spirochaetia bacterium]
MSIDLDQCVKCTTCLSQCPVGAVNVLFDGPKRLGPDLARIKRTGSEDYPASLKLCSNCKNCDLACPFGVGISRMINLARGSYLENRSFRLRDFFLANVELTGKLINTFPLNKMAGYFTGDGFPARIGQRLFGLSPTVAFFRGDGQGPASFRKARQRPGQKRVVYFPGCYAHFFEPRIGVAAVRILNHLGYRVELPDVHCCGLPQVTNGFLAAAREKAVENLSLLGPLVEKGLDIVTTCPSCGLMLRKEYAELFGLEEAGVVAAHVWDLFEFIGRDAGVDSGSLPAIHGRFAYHAPCHLRATGTRSAALALFSGLAGLEMVDLDGGCCGLSGSYGFKAENYATATAVGRKLFDRVQEVRPDKVLTECGTCKIQIMAATGLTVEHPACVLAELLVRGTV